MNKEEYARRKAAGNCVRGGCTIAAVPGKTMCRHHLAEGKDRMRRLANERRRAGLCTRCGERPLASGWFCAECLVRQHGHQRTTYARRKAEGRCYHCGAPPPLETGTLCAPCAAQHREKAARRYLARKGG